MIIALYIAAAKGLKSWRQRHAQEQTGTIGDFLTQVLAVEAEALPSRSGADRIALDQRLSDIKQTAIEWHVNGRLEDPENLHALLVSLADARTRIWGPIS